MATGTLVFYQSEFDKLKKEMEKPYYLQVKDDPTALEGWIWAYSRMLKNSTEPGVYSRSAGTIEKMIKTGSAKEYMRLYQPRRYAYTYDNIPEPKDKEDLTGKEVEEILKGVVTVIHELTGAINTLSAQQALLIDLLHAEEDKQEVQEQKQKPKRKYTRRFTNKRKHYSSEDLSFINQFKDKPVAWIARRMGRQALSVRRQMQKLGLA